jgi:hypothetical protein
MADGICFECGGSGSGCTCLKYEPDPEGAAAFERGRAEGLSVRVQVVKRERDHHAREHDRWRGLAGELRTSLDETTAALRSAQERLGRQACELGQQGRELELARRELARLRESLVASRRDVAQAVEWLTGVKL